MTDVSFWRSPLRQDDFCPTQTSRCLIIYSPFAPHIKLHINSDCKNPTTKQTKDSVQKLFPRGNLFPGAFSRVKNFGYWNCQRNAQIVKKSYKRTLNERKNFPTATKSTSSQSTIYRPMLTIGPQWKDAKSFNNLANCTSRASLPMSSATEFMTGFLSQFAGGFF